LCSGWDAVHLRRCPWNLGSDAERRVRRQDVPCHRCHTGCCPGAARQCQTDYCPGEDRLGAGPQDEARPVRPVQRVRLLPQAQRALLERREPLELPGPLEPQVLVRLQLLPPVLLLLELEQQRPSSPAWASPVPRELRALPRAAAELLAVRLWMKLIGRIRLGPAASAARPCFRLRALWRAHRPGPLTRLSFVAARVKFRTVSDGVARSWLVRVHRLLIALFSSSDITDGTDSSLNS